MGLEYLLLGVQCYVFSFSWHLFLEATYVLVANQSQVTPAPVAVSSDLSAILEAQKNSILAALNSQIKNIRTSLLKAQSDLASLIASQVQDSYVCKKRGNEQQCRLSRSPTRLVRPWRVATSPKLRRSLLKVFLYLLIAKRSLS